MPPENSDDDSQIKEKPAQPSEYYLGMNEQAIGGNRYLNSPRVLPSIDENYSKSMGNYNKVQVVNDFDSGTSQVLDANQQPPKKHIIDDFESHFNRNQEVAASPASFQHHSLLSRPNNNQLNNFTFEQQSDYIFQ